jgi:hypothetical protein
LLRMSTPRSILSRASTENFTSLAAISVSPEKQLSFSLRHRRDCPGDLDRPGTVVPAYRDGRVKPGHDGLKTLRGLPF